MTGSDDPLDSCEALRLAESHKDLVVQAIGGWALFLLSSDPVGLLGEIGRYGPVVQGSEPVASGRGHEEDIRSAGKAAPFIVFRVRASRIHMRDIKLSSITTHEGCLGISVTCNAAIVGNNGVTLGVPTIAKNQVRIAFRRCADFFSRRSLDHCVEQALAAGGAKDPPNGGLGL